jgi:hypothetical protein
MEWMHFVIAGCHRNKFSMTRHCIQSSNEEMYIQMKKCKSSTRDLVSNPEVL